MIYFLLFSVELIVLFFLSKRLINSLYRIIYRILPNHHAVVNTMAVIFLPGTIIHELAHLLFAGVMLVPVGEINLVPKVEGESVKLGSVQIGETDPLRRTIVGVAPVLMGLLCIGAIFLFIPFEKDIPWWQIALGLFLIFEIANTMFSSKKDIEGVIGFLIAITLVLFIILAVLYFLNPSLLLNIWDYLTSLNLNFAAGAFKQASIYLSIPLALDLIIILIVNLLYRKT